MQSVSGKKALPKNSSFFLFYHAARQYVTKGGKREKAVG